MTQAGLPVQDDGSRAAVADSSSLTAADDAPSPSTSTTTRKCRWCGSLLQSRRATYCSKRCRQSAWRLRRRSQLELSATPGATGALRFAYADPPYPGLSKRYYGNEPTYAGEVDHPALIASLVARHDAGEIAGWALSTSAAALRDLLPLCPQGARVASWVKPHGVSSRTYGMHNVWEPVIVVGGRKRRPGVPDGLTALPARGGGSTLMGRKPIAFCAWLFDLLGMVPGDTLDDLFPGTGIVGRAWDELSARAAATPEPSGMSQRRLRSFVDDRRVASLGSPSDDPEASP